MRVLDVIEKGWKDNKRNRKTGNNTFFYRCEEDKFYSYNKEIASIDRFGETMTLIGMTAEFDNSYRQELEDALDRVKQLDIIVRDMKAFHYQPINDDYSDSDIDEPDELSGETYISQAQPTNELEGEFDRVSEG